MMAKGKLNYQRDRECRLCGAPYISYSPNGKYCSDKCKHEAQLRYDREKYAAQVKEKRMDQKKKAHALADILKAAQEAGMSYGKYVATMKL